MGLSILIIFCSGEVMLRLFGYYGEASLRISNAYPVDDPIINYRYKPGSVYSIGNIKYKINSNGLRDNNHHFQKANNVYRIMMLGDSVAEGYGVNFEETVGNQLEKMMNYRIMSRKVEVVNIAMSGLNTYQEAHLLQTIGIKYAPDLIILCYVMNDAGESIRFKKNEKRKKYSKINLVNLRIPISIKHTLKKSALIYFIKNKIDALLWQFNINDSDDPFNSIKTDYFQSIYSDDKKWHQVLEGFSTISQIAKELHSDIIMVIFPIMYNFDNYDWANIHSRVRQSGEEQGFYVLDLLSEYSKYSVKSLRLERGDFIHPNKEGHQIAATELLKYIKEYNLMKNIHSD